MENKILDIVIENSNRRLDQVTFMDDEYRQIQKKLDRLLITYGEKSSCCCRILYRQGYIDCIHLLKEIGILA